MRVEKKKFITSSKFIYGRCTYGEVGLAPSAENGWEKVTCWLAPLLLTTALSPSTEEALNKAQDSASYSVLLYVMCVLAALKEIRRSRHFSVYLHDFSGPLVFHLLLSFPPSNSSAFSSVPARLILLVRVAVAK